MANGRRYRRGATVPSCRRWRRAAAAAAAGVLALGSRGAFAGRHIFDHHHCVSSIHLIAMNWRRIVLQTIKAARCVCFCSEDGPVEENGPRCWTKKYRCISIGCVTTIQDSVGLGVRRSSAVRPTSAVVRTKRGFKEQPQVWCGDLSRLLEVM